MVRINNNNNKKVDTSLKRTKYVKRLSKVAPKALY